MYIYIYSNLDQEPLVYERKSLATGSSELLFYKIGAPKNFAKFTGKHLCQSLFLIEGLV